MVCLSQVNTYWRRHIFGVYSKNASNNNRMNIVSSGWSQDNRACIDVRSRATTLHTLEEEQVSSKHSPVCTCHYSKIGGLLFSGSLQLTLMQYCANTFLP